MNFWPTLRPFRSPFTRFIGTLCDDGLSCSSGCETDLIFISVPGRGREEAERQSSSVVPEGRGGGAGRSRATRSHSPAECKSNAHL